MRYPKMGPRASLSLKGPLDYATTLAIALPETRTIHNFLPGVELEMCFQTDPAHPSSCIINHGSAISVAAAVEPCIQG